MGVFSGEKVLEKRVQAAAKFLSAEQEALERRMELSALKSRPINMSEVNEGDSCAAGENGKSLFCFFLYLFNH
jgi:hypothetical protein